MGLSKEGAVPASKMLGCLMRCTGLRCPIASKGCVFLSNVKGPQDNPISYMGGQTRPPIIHAVNLTTAMFSAKRFLASFSDQSVDFENHNRICSLVGLKYFYLLTY